MGLLDYAFVAVTTALAMIGAYMTILGFIARNPHALVAASMLMVSSASVVSIALMMRQFNGDRRDVDQLCLDHQTCSSMNTHHQPRKYI
ncbi:hypothetical protein JCM16161A_15900 [Vulcanisaeta sp. JCM 16161]|uniref:hypothetical protein n=1 Tax=Vulcanisaeta sp. JCM 16161 TaxID=1295372 RepID=UPI0006D0F023|nr:hypothetical protein [Vulcanisaeta sp. JCM 16161]